MGFIAIAAFNSCNYFTKKNKAKNSDSIARVYDKILTKEDIARLVPSGTKREDSILLVRNYIDNWIKNNVVLKKATDNLGDVQSDIEEKLEEYRNSLVVYMYEEALIKQQLNTKVSEEEIEKYYTDNQNNFELKENIVQAIYIKTKKDAPKIDKLRNWLNKNDEKSRQQAEEYCHQYAIDFFLNDDNWIKLEELLQHAGIKTEDKQKFLQKNRTIEFADSLNITFVRVSDFKIKNALSPLEFERENIIALIINKRKLQLVQKMEKAAYENALKNNDFEIYKK